MERYINIYVRKITEAQRDLLRNFVHGKGDISNQKGNHKLIYCTKTSE